MSAGRAAGIALAALALGIGAGWYLSRPVPVVEAAKPAETQADGSKLIERTATQPKARPKQIIPKGATVERIAAVTVQSTARPAPDQPCPPVTVDMTLIREDDGSKRVIASSPDGQIVAGLDVPVETLPTPEARPWAVGVSVDPVRQAGGVWVERDIGRVRLGVEVNQQRAGSLAPGVVVRAGWVF